MDTLQPDSYQALGEYLAIAWKDGHESMLAYSHLRDGCPCANCKGEPDLLGRVMMPAEQPARTIQSNQLVGMRPVGHYGLQLIWGDGHDTGIYTFGYLRRLCDCDACSGAQVTDS